MENAPNRTGGVFRLCTMVTMVMAFGLVVASVFSVYKYTAHDNSDWAEDHLFLTPAYRHFDANREARSVLAIRRLQGDTVPLTTASCNSLAAGATAGDGAGVTGANMWEEVTSLNTWRGTNAGCLTNGQVQAGACSGAILSTGTNVQAFAATPLNRWRNQDATHQNVFCVIRDRGQQFQAKDSDNCPAGLLDCGNHCLTVPTGWTGGCPMAAWSMTLAANKPSYTGQAVVGDNWGPSTGAADTWNVYYNRLTATADNTAESVGMSVSWYGAQCINPTREHKDPSGQYVLMASQGIGCCGLKTNPMSEQADSQKEWDYLMDNKALLTDATTHKNALDTLPNYQQSINTHQDYLVYLNNNRRILTRPTLQCDQFRFNTQGHATRLLSFYDSIWNLIKWLAIVATSCALVALMMVLLVVLTGYQNQTQYFMTLLYTVCLIGLFVTVVLVWKARYLINTSYVTPHAHFQAAVDEKCITNQSWSALLTMWNNHTSFNLGNSLFYLLILFVIMLLVGVIFAIWALMQLAETANGRRNNM